MMISNYYTYLGQLTKKTVNTLPLYWIDKPLKFLTASGLTYSITVDGQKHDFQLYKNTDLFSSGFHSVVRYGNSEQTLNFETGCVYVGNSTSHNNTKIALVGCGSNAQRGLIIKDDGYYLIHPNVKEQSQQHIIHKRSLTTIKHNYRLHTRDDPIIDDENLNSIFHSFTNDFRFRDIRDLTIELGVFVDDALWFYFHSLYGKKADKELQQYVLAIVNNIGALFGHSSMQPKIRIKITRYEVMKVPPPQLSRNLHLNGEVDRLLDIFCKYQRTLNVRNDANPRHWDHALLLSGYDLYRPGMKAIAGYAPVKKMCSEDRSCTINEGLDFGSVFVIAHEIGHSLGMSHDGDNGCDPNCCVMSRSIGRGKTSWSQCSVEELQRFVSQLGSRSQPNCLLDGSTRHTKSLAVHPGQQFTVDEQCMFFHGNCWKHELKDGQLFKDICQIVWCGNGEGIVRTAHPALEGTYCGDQMWCIEGKCVASNYALHPVDGAWSEWSNSQFANCASECVPCSIRNQIRIRRTHRRCSNPFPNNGGMDCVGDSVRGIRCQMKECTGLEPDEYATQKCTELKKKSNADLSAELTGKGHQFEEAMCKIWCVIRKNRIRTIGNFPDGTPCGTNQYCVRGECRTLACGGRAVVDTSENCPSDIENTNSIKLPALSFTNNLPRSSIIRSAITAPTGVLTEWSTWSLCQSPGCNQVGTRTRSRTCLTKNCSGSLRQRQTCYVPCPAPTPSLWSEWSSCSATCGYGVKKRTRECDDCDTKVQQRPCFLKSCLSMWNVWEEWSRCSATCGPSNRIRRRICSGVKCLGHAMELQRCVLGECLKTRSQPFQSGKAGVPEWLEWSSWGPCSVSCGSGISKRTRKCSTEGACEGIAYKVSSCRQQPCPIPVIRRYWLHT